MEVLYVAHRAPFPPDKGDRLRAWRHLTRLSRFADVDIVAQADSEDEAEVARQGLAELCREVHVFARRSWSALWEVAWSVPTGRSLTVGWHTDPRVERALEDLEQRHDYDLCWAFSSGTGPWMERRRAPHRVMDLCDVDALKWDALGRDGLGPRSWVYRLEAKRLLPLELRLARDADLTLVITGQEADDLRTRTEPRRLEILTNGTPWEEFTSLRPPSAAGPVVGFLGQMDYPPNVVAARHLARDVMPAVRERVPDALLRIFGRSPSPAVRELESPGQVEVTGAVESIPEALETVRVFCAPLDRGRGLPNKILEALAAGRAAVVSSWSARALSGVADRDYVVADTDEERRRCVADLLADPARCDALGEAGRAYVRADHDWDAVLDRLEGLVREVVGA